MTKISLTIMMFFILVSCGQKSAEEIVADSQNCNRFQIELEAIPTAVPRGEMGQIIIRVMDRASGFNDFIEPTFSLRGAPTNQFLESWEFSLPQITPNSNDATILDFTLADSAIIGFLTFDISASSIEDGTITCSNEIVITIE